ncbi:MAG: PRC-barrel domain-containing protein [Beijerinckiaceae bacterium]
MSFTKTIAVSTFAIMAASAANAACNYDLSAIDKKIGAKGYATYATSSRDIRQMRDTARRLDMYDQESACQAVVKAINDIVDNRVTPKDMAARSGDSGDKKDMAARKDAASGDQKADRVYNRAELAKASRPVWGGKGFMSADKIVGSTIYSMSTGDNVGEIEDVLVSSSADKSYAVISHGGFLGMGEQKYKIPLSAVRYNANDNSYYVAMTNKDFEAAPQVKYENNQWVGRPVTVRMK